MVLLKPNHSRALRVRIARAISENQPWVSIAHRCRLAGAGVAVASVAAASMSAGVRATIDHANGDRDTLRWATAARPSLLSAE